MKGRSVFIICIVAVLTVSLWLAHRKVFECYSLHAFVVAMAMMYFLVRNIIVISYRKKLFDLPDARRIHKKPTSRLGGFLFTPIIICSTVIAVSLRGLISPEYIPLPDCLILICPLIFMWLTGITDDLIGVHHTFKFVVQVVAALFVVYSGLWIDDLHGVAGIGALPPALGMPLTVFLIVLAVNSINLIDGMDGLAGGLCIIAAGTYGVFLSIAGAHVFSFIAFAAVGVLIPYLYVNVHGMGPRKRKRKIFMGDAGSLTLGLVLSILALALMAGVEGAESPSRQNFILALSPLLVPVIDVAHVMLFRIKNGKSPFQPDKTHIHHRLMAKGFRQRETVMLILGLSAVFTVVNMLLAGRMNATWILLLDAAVWIAFNSRLLRAGEESIVEDSMVWRHIL